MHPHSVSSIPNTSMSILTAHPPQSVRSCFAGFHPAFDISIHNTICRRSSYCLQHITCGSQFGQSILPFRLDLNAKPQPCDEHQHTWLVPASSRTRAARCAHSLRPRSLLHPNVQAPTVLPCRDSRDSRVCPAFAASIAYSSMSQAGKMGTWHSSFALFVCFKSCPLPQ